MSKRSLWKHYFSRLAFSFLKSDLIFGIRVGPTHSVQQCHSHLVMCVSLSIDLMRCGFGELECIWKFVPAFQFTDSQLTVLIKWKKTSQKSKTHKSSSFQKLQSCQIKMIKIDKFVRRKKNLRKIMVYCTSFPLPKVPKKSLLRVGYIFCAIFKVKNDQH